MLIRIEFILAGMWLLGAFVLAGRMGRSYRCWRLFRLFIWTPSRGVLAVGFFAFLASALLSLAISWPQPRIHDEFSYLLAADTFAHGRLTNPAHPMGVFFETFHVNQEPTYCSIYPPCQGLFLALGQRLGHPLIGVWISFALACAAICWMLQAFVPLRWAVTGGLLAAVQLGIVGSAGSGLGYWSQSYWGGATAMLGGALVFGALRRLVREPRVCHAMMMGLGLAVLANSRPFEGAIFALPIAFAMIAWLAGRSRPAGQITVSRVLLPISLVLGLTAAGIAHYNACLTGNPLRLPYQQNGDAYGMIPLFLWQPLKTEPAYQHDAIRDYHVRWALPAYLRLQDPAGYVDDLVARARTLSNFYLGPILLVPLFALRSVLRDRWTRFAAGICALLLLALCLTTWLQPHYAAPATVLLFLLVVQGLRQLQLWRVDGRPVGRALVGTLPIVFIVLVAVSLPLHAEANSDSWHLRRAGLLAELQQTPGRHLVIVRYGPGHSPHQEWVFNDADIDQAKVVWARDMSPEANLPLVEYFKDRHIWLLLPDSQPVVLRHY